MATPVEPVKIIMSMGGLIISNDDRPISLTDKERKTTIFFMVDNETRIRSIEIGYIRKHFPGIDRYILDRINDSSIIILIDEALIYSLDFSFFTPERINNIKENTVKLDFHTTNGLITEYEFDKDKLAEELAVQ